MLHQDNPKLPTADANPSLHARGLIREREQYPPLLSTYSAGFKFMTSMTSAAELLASPVAVLRGLQLKVN